MSIPLILPASCFFFFSLLLIWYLTITPSHPEIPKTGKRRFRDFGETPTSTQKSFPQFTRLPAELRLEILAYHRDHSLVRRHHYVRSWRNVFYADNPWERVMDYKCLDLHDNTRVMTDDARTSGRCSHDEDEDDMADYVYAGDGLASERIRLDSYSRSSSSSSSSSSAGQDPRALTHVWANLATDVFTFQDLWVPRPDAPPPPYTCLGALADAGPLADGAHWFWRVRKLALEVREAGLAAGHVLGAFDAALLQRTTALRTVYVVADRGCGACGRLPCGTTTDGLLGSGGEAPLPTTADGFVAPEDYRVRGAQPTCRGQRYFLGPPRTALDALAMARRLKRELDGLFSQRAEGGGGGRPVKVRVVFSPVRLRHRAVDFAKVGVRPGDDLLV